ncbi:MAG: phosphate ABC transporter permease PstA [Armatimonadaceae bacterium]
MSTKQPGSSAPDLRGNGKRRLQQKVMFGVMAAGMLAVIIPTAYIFLQIILGGFGQMTWEFLTQRPADGGAAGGIGPAILGTFGLMLFTVLLALPLGVLAAIYLTEYARRGPIVRAIRMAIVNLAGVPSIVHGLFGLIVFKIFLGGWLDYFAGNTQGVWRNKTLLWGAATLAILVLPVIITATEEALRSVPRSFREGSMGLGATRLQTIYKIVLPAALPGIMTGAILAVGRAAGETAPILLTAAVAFTTTDAMLNLSQPVLALPYQLYYVVTTAKGVSLEMKYGIALTLLILVFVVNLAAILIRSHLRRTRRW